MKMEQSETGKDIIAIKNIIAWIKKINGLNNALDT